MNATTDYGGNMKIVFLGDSITDCGRNEDNGSMSSIGQGYACLIASRLNRDEPKMYEFINSGVSGSRIVDLYARIKSDCWNLEPDVISILIGVNDVWHECGGNGVEADRFYNVYKMLVKDTLNRLPDAKIIVMEPFVVKGYNTVGTWEEFRGEVEKRACAARKVAEEYGATFIPLQEVFDSASQTVESTYWSADGVHPSLAGHQMIADEWIRVFKEKSGGLT